jgi:hypothetical protein
MASKSLPDNLYVYLMHTMGGPIAVCAEPSTGEDMWEMVKKAKTPEGNDLRLWVRLQNGTYERLFWDASSIMGISDKQPDVPTQRPNERQIRKERPTATASSAIARKTHPSRVTIGKIASKPAGRKR